MAINVSQSFHRTSANAVDDTLTLTKAEMLAVNDNLMPAKYLTVCQDDGYIYLYDKSATPNGTTGKFTKFEGGSGVTNYNDLENRPQIEGVTLTGNKTAANLGLAKTSDLPSVYDGDTAGLVPAAGSDNEGKYLDNDGNWTTVPMPMIGTINRSDIYDTTEKVVGKWTDGRPVYQKVLTGTLTGCGTQGVTVSTSVSMGATINHFVSADLFVYKSNNGVYQKINILKETSTAGSYISIYATCYNDSASSSLKNKIVIDNSWFAVDTTYYIVVKYTKTTDAANSYNYADENDYSTSEKIIGKWIDGKTLYQKTVNFGALPNNTAKTVAHGISSLGEIINISGSSYILGGAGRTTKFYIDLPNNDPVINISADSTYIYVSTESDLSSSTAYVTLKYTKTTS